MFRKMSSFRALLGASVCLLPLLPVAAFADDFDVGAKQDVAAAPVPSENWITVGGQYSSGRSDYLNRFNGDESPGWNALGSFNYLSRDAWDSGNTFYFNASGDRLGDPDRSISFRAGQQGTWGVNFSYDGIYYDGGHNYQSVYTPNGTLIQAIAPGSVVVGYGSTPMWTPQGVFNQTTAYWPGHGTVTKVNPLWQPIDTSGKVPTQAYDLSLQRDIFNLGGKYQYGDWTITSGWRHEHKEGWQQQSLTIAGKPSLSASSATQPTSYTSGGMAYFIQPINYDTDRFDVTAQYATKRYQVQLNYNFSQFQDNDQSITLLNPWAGYPKTTAVNYILPPDNSAQQIKGQFGYNITDNTRLNVNMAYGMQMQNEQFMFGTGTPGTSSGVATNGAQSLQGFIETIFGSVALTSQPIKGLDLHLGYTIDNRDNETPSNVWTMINTTSAGSGAAFTSPNFPFTFRHQTVVAEAGYRVWGQTKLTVTNTLDDTYRSYGASTDVQTERLAGKLRGPVIDGIYASLSGAYEDRWAANYNANAIWNVIYGAGGAAADNSSNPNNFLMFDEASRKHSEVKAMVDASPLDGLSVSVMGKFSEDTYPSASTALGMRNNHNLAVGPDLAWEASKALTLHAFYTYQQLYFDEAASYSTGTLVLPFNIADTNSVQTAGVDAEWHAIPDKLKINFDANLSVGDTAYGMGEGVVPMSFTTNSLTTIGAVTVTPLPDVKSTMISLSMRGEYTINPSTSVLFGYAFERFNYKDYVNNIGATQYANAFLPGTMNPNEGVHIFSAAVRVRF